MSKKNRKRRGNPVEITNYGYGIDAAAYSPNRSFNLFPSCNGREVTRAGRQRLVSRARSLYYNSPEVRSAVKTLCMLVGTLKPLARTADEEWNRLAQDAFARRTSNPTTFELTNSLNFAQLQSYIEEKANVDGDCLVVLTTDKTGGGVAVYPSDMIKGADNNDGVVLDKYGRPKEYIITSADKETRIPAKNCILYRHNPDPTDPRGMTDLVAAITTA